MITSTQEQSFTHHELTPLQQRARELRRTLEEEARKGIPVRETAEMQQYLLRKFGEDYPSLHQLLMDSGFNLSSAYSDKPEGRKYYLVLAQGEKRTMLAFHEENIFDKVWVYNGIAYRANPQAEDALTLVLDEFFFG